MRVGGSRILANAPWETIYLQTAHAYKEEPELNRLIDKIADAAWAAAVADGSSSSQVEEAQKSTASKTSAATEESKTLARPIKREGSASPEIPPTGTMPNAELQSADSRGERCRLGPDVIKDLSRSDVNLRVVELHTVEQGGALPNPEHFDGGSVLTVGKNEFVSLGQNGIGISRMSKLRFDVIKTRLFPYNDKL